MFLKRFQYFLWICSAFSLTTSSLQSSLTCILSRRWQDLWTGITDIDITPDHLFPGNISKQIEYIDAILSRPELNLIKCHIKLCLTEERHAPVLACWADELLRRGVSELGLINVALFYAPLPPPLSSKSLTVLKLRACKLEDSNDGCSPLAGCPNLKSLYLEGVAVSVATIREVLSSCEYLESLNVQYCNLYGVVAHHQRLGCFILRSRVCHCVDVSIPNLEVLELRVSSELKRIRVSAPRVRRSSIYFQWRRGLSDTIAEQLGGLLVGIASSEYLQLCGALCALPSSIIYTNSVV